MNGRVPPSQPPANVSPSNNDHSQDYQDYQALWAKFNYLYNSGDPSLMNEAYKTAVDIYTTNTNNMTGPNNEPALVGKYNTQLWNSYLWIFAKDVDNGTSSIPGVMTVCSNPNPATSRYEIMFFDSLDPPTSNLMTTVFHDNSYSGSGTDGTGTIGQMYMALLYQLGQGPGWNGQAAWTLPPGTTWTTAPPPFPMLQTGGGGYQDAQNAWNAWDHPGGWLYVNSVNTDGSGGADWHSVYCGNDYTGDPHEEKEMETYVTVLYKYMGGITAINDISNQVQNS